jgi:ABC-type Fe3+/spermidine/putrescine transport system ATPase subunit
MSVELRDVSKRFGDFIALQSTSLQIHDGEFFALLGPSGCGKNHHAAHDCRFRIA